MFGFTQSLLFVLMSATIQTVNCTIKFLFPFYEFYET